MNPMLQVHIGIEGKSSRQHQPGMLNMLAAVVYPAATTELRHSVSERTWGIVEQAIYASVTGTVWHSMKKRNKLRVHGWNN
jgi:hypothetical protein